MHVAVEVRSAQGDGQIEEAYLLDEFRREKPQSLAVEHLPQEGRCHLHALFREKDCPQSMMRIVQITAIVCQDGTQFGPEPLTYLELTPPRCRSLIPIHVVLTEDLSRFEHLIGDEVSSIRSHLVLETHSILENENTSAFHVAKVGRKNGLCPKDGVGCRGAFVAPKAIRFSNGVTEGTVDEVLQI